MSNFTFLAQNNDKDSYVKQACLLRLYIPVTNKESKICLTVNDKVQTLNTCFLMILCPGTRYCHKHDKWKVQNRWKIYLNNLRRNFVMDTDMLVLQDPQLTGEPNAKL